MNKTILIYCDWTLHDELADTVKLDETMTQKALDRLEYWQKEYGLKFDYYLIDAFWYDPEGNYQQFKRPHWPNGFISVRKRMDALGMTPGLWFDVNGWSSPRCKDWKKSLATDGQSYCLFDGPYAKSLEEALINAYNSWGVKLFKLDSANFGAVTPRLVNSLSRDEIYLKNTETLKQILRNLRSCFSDIVIMAYNGYELVPNYIINTSYSFRRGIDPSWLEVFDYIYSGDPRPADTPCISFRHSLDVYQSYMVRNLNFSGIPLDRIDDCGCFVGDTHSIYRLGKRSWRRTWILSLSRGNKRALLYGNLHLLDDSDAQFLLKAKQIFFSLFSVGLETYTVGGILAHSPWHGFLTGGGSNGLLTLINTTEFSQHISLEIPGLKGVKVLFSDTGNVVRPQVCSQNLSLILASEQMVLLGLGEMAKFQYYLGINEDDAVPYNSRPVSISFKVTAPNTLEGKWIPGNNMSKANKTFLRISLQTLKNGIAFRLKSQKGVDLRNIRDLFSITVSQNERELPIAMWEPSRAVWSGCSWMTGLYNINNLEQGKPVKINCSYCGNNKVKLMAKASVLKFQ